VTFQRSSRIVSEAPDAPPNRTPNIHRSPPVRSEPSDPEAFRARAICRASSVQARSAATPSWPAMDMIFARDRVGVGGGGNGRLRTRCRCSWGRARSRGLLRKEQSAGDVERRVAGTPRFSPLKVKGRLRSRRSEGMPVDWGARRDRTASPNGCPPQGPPIARPAAPTGASRKESEAPRTGPHRAAGTAAGVLAADQGGGGADRCRLAAGMRP
jgi:hypothetical protein